MMRRLLLSALLLTACRGSVGSTAVDPQDASQEPVDAEDAGVDPGDDADDDEERDSGGFNEPSRDAGDRDAGVGARDASGGMTTMPDAGVPPSGDTVPVFVAMGYGSYRVISCDYGQTWVNEQEEAANGGDDGDLVRGLGAGGGKFVAAVGGGGVRKLWTSDDGVSWTKMMREGSGYSDVAYGNGRFVAGGGHESIVSRDGITWEQPGKMGEGGILRHMAFGNHNGGRFVAVGDNGRRMMSVDGVMWTAQIEEGPTLYGVDYGAGVFVAITQTSETRYSEDGGATWKRGNIDGASDVRGILYDGKRFLVTTATNTFTSTDGKSWQSHTANGGPGSFAISDDGHYAGARGQKWEDLMVSTDGLTWRVVKTARQPFSRLKFQRVKPSDVCKK